MEKLVGIVGNLASALALAVPLAAHGQGSSLEDLVRSGLEKNLALQLKRQEVHTLSVDTLGSVTAVNPHLEAEAMHNLTEPGSPTAGIRILREFQPGIRGKRRKAALGDWAARDAELEAEIQELIEGIRTAYFEWQVLNRKAKLQEEVIDRWEGLARLAGSQMAQGKLSEVDQAEMQLNAVKAGQRALTLVSEKESHEERLRLLTGLAPAPAPLDSAALDTLPVPPTLDSLRAWASRSSPALVALSKTIDAQRHRLALEEGLTRPGFNLSLGYEREAEGDHMVGGGVEVPLAVFNRNQAGVSRAKSSLREAELRRAAAEAALLSEVAAIHRRLARLTEQYSQYRSKARGLIRKQLRLAELGFRQGMLGVFDLSRVQAEYLAQEEEGLDILEAYYREWNRLGKVVGGKLW